RAFARSITLTRSNSERSVRSARKEKMKEHEVRDRAFAMPLTSPAYPVGMPAPAERTVRMEAQHLIDVRWQGGNVDAPPREIAGGEGSGDRPRLLPQPQRIDQVPRIIPWRAWRRDRTVPVVERGDGFIVIEPFDLHQPVDPVAMRAAGKAVEVIVIEV